MTVAVTHAVFVEHFFVVPSFCVFVLVSLLKVSFVVDP